MRNINRLCQMGLGLVLGTILFPIIASAQQPFPWQSNLEDAQRIAAQNNRLVLIHFWAPWCGACKRMETEVFNQPGVAASLLANYVPVKINADQMPATATKFGITALPTDVVITPQGQIVDSIRGRTEATQYVARLNQVASARQPNAGQIAQVPANIPALPADRSTAEQSAANNQPAAINALSDNRYADYYRRNSDDQRDQQLSAATSSREPVQPSTATISPSYAQQQPAAGPELSAPNLVQSPETPTPQVQNITPPPTVNTPMTNVAQQYVAKANTAQQTPPFLNQSSQSPSINTLQQAPSAANPYSPAPMANTAQQIPPAADASSPSLGANPSLCLDGYCPLSLTEKQQWIPGDRRFGAIHRGRTYIFAGPEEQRRFFTDPDRYAPVISGNDVIQAMERGQTVPGKREHGVFYNNHIFLFADEAGLEKFSKNPAYYANQALEAIQASNHVTQQMR